MAENQQQEENELWKSVLRGDLLNVKKLLGKRDASTIYSEREPLVHWAAKQRNLSTLEWLLGVNGVDVDFKDDGGWTCLLLSVFDENIEATEVLLRFGANPNIIAPTSRNYSPLMMASFRGREQLVEMLLKAGADPNYRSSTDGKSALDLALEQGHQEIVSLLKQ
jgi:ankyrin repeat protein